jgi:putative transposase
MRKEAFTINSLVHVYNRGNRKAPIVKDNKDRLHFLEMLYYFNDGFICSNPFRGLKNTVDIEKSRSSTKNVFPRPSLWPPRNPLVKILAFILMENHFHLFVKEIQEDGVSMFMKRLGTGMTMHFNTKYKEVGGLFQGSYKAKVVDEERYAQYLSVYIQVKNAFELYPTGFARAIQEFDKAYEWATAYPYNSLGDYMGTRYSSIIDKDILGELFSSPKQYKEFARQCLHKANFEETIQPIIFEK